MSIDPNTLTHGDRTSVVSGSAKGSISWLLVGDWLVEFDALDTQKWLKPPCSRPFSKSAPRKLTIFSSLFLLKLDLWGFPNSQIYRTRIFGLGPGICHFLSQEHWPLRHMIFSRKLCSHFFSNLASNFPWLSPARTLESLIHENRFHQTTEGSIVAKAKVNFGACLMWSLIVFDLLFLKHFGKFVPLSLSLTSPSLIGLFSFSQPLTMGSFHLQCCSFLRWPHFCLVARNVICVLVSISSPTCNRHLILTCPEEDSLFKIPWTRELIHSSRQRSPVGSSPRDHKHPDMPEWLPPLLLYWSLKSLIVDGTGET